MFASSSPSSPFLPFSLVIFFYFKNYEHDAFSKFRGREKAQPAIATEQERKANNVRLGFCEERKREKERKSKNICS